MFNGIETGGIEVDLSIVIPTYNEEGNVVPLHNELSKVLGGVGSDYEIMFSYTMMYMELYSLLYLDLAKIYPN